MTLTQRGLVAERLVEVWKVKKHCELYMLEKYFVHHMWCQNGDIDTFVLRKSVYVEM